ncbi:unnamed protein product [Pieris brassicae]|uniref:Uncharacterized protein n=1 Tax=Pieris brassicae TaxID=7116 RepID=A0A9P0TB60_PIEBR|nr:unnamed protein product [Pieris brassicae]
MKTCVLLFTCFAIVQSRNIGSIESSSVKVIHRNIDSVDLSLQEMKSEPLHKVDDAFVKSHLLEKMRKYMDLKVILEKSDTKKLLRRKRAIKTCENCALGETLISIGNGFTMCVNLEQGWIPHQPSSSHTITPQLELS